MEGMITMQGFMKMEYRSAWITFPITWDICLPEEKAEEQKRYSMLDSTKSTKNQHLKKICIIFVLDLESNRRIFP